MSKKRKLRRTKATGKRRLTKSEKTFLDLANKIKPKDIRYGKRKKVRGKYVISVLGRRGKVLATLPWRQNIKREFRAAIEMHHGRPTRKTLKELGINLPGWTVMQSGYDPKTREAVWRKHIYSVRKPVPIGTPDIGSRSKSFGYFGKAIKSVKPERLLPHIRKLPKKLRSQGGASIGLRFKLVNTSDGEETTYVYLKDSLYGFTLATSEKLFISSLVASALMEIAQYYGYAGQMAIASVSLVVGGQL